MAFWNKWFARQRDEPIPTGRITAIEYYGALSPYRSRTANILETLRSIPEEAEAIDYLRKVTPDVSMAVWNFLRLANQGHTMRFYDVRDRERRLPRAEARWREFAERVNEISNSGMDGLLDQLHASAFLRGAMGLEAEVNSSRTDIVDLYPVIPQTIVWKLEDRNGRKKWIPYQQQALKEVSLEPGKANFFWVPVDPDIEDPRGNLIMAPVLWAIDFQLQILQDLQAVLHHQGWPRNDVSISLERLKERMPPEIKANPKKMSEWILNEWDTVIQKLKSLNPDSDFVHLDEVTVQLAQGGNAARSLDVRAVTELVDVQVLNGLKQMGIVTNRVGGLGQTESWGSITFKIFCAGIASIQRGSKRLMEEVARLWLRVNGMQGIPVFEHNVVDWQSEEQKMNVLLMKQQFHAIAQLMGWETGDQAALEVLDAEKAVGAPSQNIRVSLSAGGNQGVPQQLSGELQSNRDNKVLQLRQRNAGS